MSKTVFGLVKVNNILLNFLFTAFKNSMKTFLLAPKTFLKNHKIHNTVYKKPHEDCHACADAACRVSLQHTEEGRVHKTVDKSHVEGHLVGHGLLRLNSRRKSSKWIPVMMQYV